MAEKNETDFILNYMSEVEAVAEEILTSKQHMIELDKKRQKSREAIRFVMIILVHSEEVFCCCRLSYSYFNFFSISCLLICIII